MSLLPKFNNAKKKGQKLMKKFIYFLAVLFLVMPIKVWAQEDQVVVNPVVSANGEITVNYTNVGAYQYIIRRSVNGGTFKEVARVSTLKYVDKNLNKNSSYAYQIEAIKKVNGQDYYMYSSNYKNIYPIKSLETPNFTIKKLKDYTRGLEIAVSSYSDDYDYELYEIASNGNYQKIATIWNGKYNLSYVSYETHKYAVRVVKNNGNEYVYSNYKIINYTYKPEAPTVKLTALNYDKNKVVIKAPKTYDGSSLSGDKKGILYVYRSTDNKNWTKVKTIKNINFYSDTEYTDTIKDAKVGTTYYYRAVLEYDGVKSANGAVVKVKSTLAVPTFNIYNSGNDNQTIEITNVSKNITYEIYQATKKDGTYKKVCSTKKSKCVIKATYGKKYFYKVRAVLGKSKSKYSGIKNLKVEIKNIEEAKSFKIVSRYSAFYDKSILNKYYGGPIYYNEYAEAEVASVKMTRKSSSKYELKLTYKYKKSDGKKTLPLSVVFYNYDYTKAYVVDINEKFVNGTKKNVTSKYTVKVPKWAMFYDFA